MGLSESWIVCGTTYDDSEIEARIVALRRVEGHQAEAGCSKNIRADFAYRCVECGRWFHRECILAHFASHGDHYADTIATLTRERDEALGQIEQLKAGVEVAEIERDVLTGWEAELLSEGQAARLLGVDRLEARAIRDTALQQAERRWKEHRSESIQ